MSDRYNRLINALNNGEHILIDGATGTEVEKRGVPQLENAWNGGGALSHPDILREIHEDYIRAGAHIIISNTFATHRSALEDAGEAHNFEAYNRRGVELACEARERSGAEHVLVAGGLSHWTWIDNDPPIEKLKDAAREQAAIMADAGAELLMLEMMIEVGRLEAVLEAALETGLPVWPGLTCRVDPKLGVVLDAGEPLADAMAIIEQHNVDLVNIMHTEVTDINACLDALTPLWDGLVGVYAHASEYVDDGGFRWNFNDVISPQAYQGYVEQWLAKDVRLIGSCCGTGPHHIEHLANCHSYHQLS